MSYAQVWDLVRRALPAIAPGQRPGALKLKGKVLLAALPQTRRLTEMAGSGSPALQQIMQERPQTLIGPLVWPYLCAGWNSSERLRHVTSHYRIIDGLGTPFPFSVHDHLVLADLAEIHPGLRIVLDQPPWFIREGGLTVNLFVDDFRAYSLAFSFAPDPGGTGIDCLIGSIQGRNVDNSTDLYRDLTKAAHGLRPRDLLLEVCRILCRHWQVSRLLAVRDSQRHHRHPFFGSKLSGSQDYDAIWKDRGGVEENAHFYRLPIASERRTDEEIKPNKRSLYRRRYRFLDMLETRIPESLPDLQPQRAADRQRGTMTC